MEFLIAFFAMAALAVLLVVADKNLGKKE